MWSTLRKSFADIIDPSRNTLLKALYSTKIMSGIASYMNDTPEAYIRQGYTGNADVYSIINRIVRMSSQARLALYRVENNKWVEVLDHELTAFTRSANPTMSINEFIGGHLVYKLSIGNSYWYKPVLDAGVNRGKTTELWLMPANNVLIKGGESWMNPIGGYELNTNTTVPFSVEEVYHSKFFNPLFGEYGTLYGLSPLRAASRIVAKMNEAETTELKQFQNQSPPYLLFKDTQDALMGTLDDTQVAGIEKTFKDYGKKHKSGAPIVLPEKFGMIKLGVSPVDLGILESSQEGRRILCNIFGLQSELFNDKARSTYNNVIEVKKDAWNNCIKPNLDDTASALTSFLIDKIPAYKGLFFAFDYSQIAELQDDYAKMVEWMSKAKYTPNEMREATGAQPFDNELMNEPWIAMGESPLSSMANTVDPLPLKNFDYK